MIDRPVLTVNQVAELLQSSRWKVYELMREGQLRYFYVGARRRILREALVEYLHRSDDQQIGA